MRLENGDVLFQWPLALHIITAGWTYNSGGAHNAIDLRAAVGTPVYAAENGTVDQLQVWDKRTKTGMQSYGTMCRIKHADYKGRTLHTRYAHLSEMCVEIGERVKEGQLIGFSGDTGNCLGAHLHFEVIYAQTRCNPLNWLDNDFTCKDSTVAKHLGSYTSVVRPEAVAAMLLYMVELQPMSAGDKDALLEWAKSRQLEAKASEVNSDAV